MNVLTPSLLSGQNFSAAPNNVPATAYAGNLV